MSVTLRSRLSKLLLLLLLVGCAGSVGAQDAMATDTPAADAADVVPNSLSGSFACGSQTCGDGQICVRFSGGSDSGIPNPGASCSDPPADCRTFYDCDGNACLWPQHHCARVVCHQPDPPPYALDGGGWGWGSISVSGRNIACGGV